jgi:LDH2 family malate/lactate/ureidoglycolate dehydrogenase
MTETPRYAAADLLAFATQLIEHAGLPSERAATMAEILLEADLMGHTTHGLNQLAAYLRDLEADKMTKEGSPTVLADNGSAVTWDGRYLPGVCLVVEAMNLAFERMAQYPMVTVAIQNSHHIACLAAYMKRATDRGLFMLLASSDPSEKGVAPFGGVERLYTPNPLAAGIPTQGDPIIVDISMSNTAIGYVNQYRQAGKKMPGQWILDSEGNASDDPNDFFADPPGSILPLGGMDLGYKGFALGLLIEALTSALAGSGRSQPHRWGASVFLQIINPDAFGGLGNFTREMQWLADAAHANKTRPGEPPVRLPGERGLKQRAEYLANGVVLYPTIMPALAEWAEKFGVPLPVVFRF